MQKKSNGPDVSSRVNNFLSVRRNQVFVFLGLGGVVVLLMAAMTLVILQMTNLVDLPVFAAAPTPTSAVPTPACVQPKLAVGAIQFQIQSLKRSPGGAISIPTDTPDAAYWIEGTNSTFVFGLSPSTAAEALGAALRPGDPVKITWADCSTEEYVVKAVTPGVLEPAALTDQSTPGVRVFLPASTSQPGLLIQGVRPEIQTAATPEPAQPGEVQAQVEFLDTKVSEDGKTLTLSIAITNQGSAPINLTAGSLSLQTEGEAALSPTQVEPALPQQIAPGARLQVVVTFPKPKAVTAVFKVLNFSVDLYY